MVEENFHFNPRVAPNKMIHSLIKKTHGQSKTQTADRRVGVKLQTDGKNADWGPGMKCRVHKHVSTESCYRSKVES